MSPSIIRIGTRGSPLALAQSGIIRDQLASRWKTHRFELEIIKTTGDALQETPLKPAGSTKAIFTKEIEEALLEKKIDLAVHSAKDLAAEMPPGLVIGAVPARLSPCDVLLLKPGHSLEAIEQELVLTGSARRRRQWLDLYPKSRVSPVRGNIDTRIHKLLEHPDAGALLLASAGLLRLNPELQGCTCLELPASGFIPAPGQGTLALQCREEDTLTLNLLHPLHHEESSLTLRAERAFLHAMDAGCSVPLGALAKVNEAGLEMDAVFYPAETSSALRFKQTGSSKNPEALGSALARKFHRGNK